MNITESHSRKAAKTTITGILVNIVLAIVKGTAGILGNSYALVADAVESTSDIFSSFIIWNGIRFASKPPDREHPYGHGKAEPLSAIAIALMLLIATGVITVQSIQEIMTPHHAPEPFTLWVLCIVVVVKELLFRYVIKTGHEVRSMAVITDAWHHRSDAITSAAVFVGISIALIGGEGYESADDWAALFAAGVIALNAFRLMRPAFNEIMDHTPLIDLTPSIVASAMQVDGVHAVEHCIIRKMGFQYYVDLHIEVPSSLTVLQGHDISHQVKDSILRTHPIIANVLVHIEPYPNPHANKKPE